MAMALDQLAGRKDPLTDLDELRAVRASVLSLAQRFDPAAACARSSWPRASGPPRSPATPWGPSRPCWPRPSRTRRPTNPERTARPITSSPGPSGPSHTRDLLDTAEALQALPATEATTRRGSLGELKDAARRIRFAAEPDPEAHAADALVEALCGDRGEQPTSAKPKFIVRLDHAAPVRGNVEGDEVCEVVGVGPVSVGAVKELALEEDPFRWQS